MFWSAFVGVMMWASCLILFEPVTSSGNVVSMSQRLGNNDNVGNLTNCGSPESKLHFTWSPRVLRPGLTITAEIYLETVASFESGDVYVTVWYKNIPRPFINESSNELCENLRKDVHQFYDLPCPVPKGYIISLKKSYTFDPTVPLPPGKFTVIGGVKNQDNVQLVCLSGIIEITRD